jgi:hypothetical protein
MIKDSGDRREFATGAVRDMAAGKGRFDLMPLDTLVAVFDDDFICSINSYMKTGDSWAVHTAARELTMHFPTQYHAWLELAKHFENGALKYGEYNWQKGIESRSYIDSAMRHYCKFKAGMDDEQHLTAALWNCVCCLWTINNKPELNSFPVEREEKE